jgi:hypothetical protein
MLSRPPPARLVVIGHPSTCQIVSSYVCFILPARPDLKNGMLGTAQIKNLALLGYRQPSSPVVAGNGVKPSHDASRKTAEHAEAKAAGAA